ncbi:MAG: hypothetical protein ACKPKO_55020 [Candidatus Fonsibacter sp.]
MCPTNMETSDKSNSFQIWHNTTILEKNGHTQISTADISVLFLSKTSARI